MPIVIVKKITYNKDRVKDNRKEKTHMADELDYFLVIPLGIKEEELQDFSTADEARSYGDQVYGKGNYLVDLVC